jgi:pimeloyl-ACP methyl ester carboxylesterase
MDRSRGSWLFLGAATGITAVALWHSQQRRRALARRARHFVQESLTGLGVPAESTYLPGKGVQLHVVLAGPEDGPLAVLLHGFPECWYSWRKQIPVLAQAGYCVLTPDQRGYNLSDRPKGIQSYKIDLLTGDILALIRALGRERATIVAHDWGGAVAWRFAMDYPEAVERLVVMNAPHPVAFARALASDWSQRLRSWYMFSFQLPWLPEAALTLSPRGTARLFFQRTAVRTNAFSSADLEIMAAALAQPGAMKAMIHWYRAAFRYRAAERTRPIEAPALLIWAEDDIALGKPLTYGLDRWVPELQVHYVPHCGHWVQNEAPEEVNEQLIAFLRQER